MGRVSYTKHGEERIAVSSTFDIDLTSRCNFRCKFCFKDGRAGGPDISFEDFKKIINEIHELGQKHGIKPNICVGGGEPFLNKDAPRMLKYAVGILGVQAVEVTTNMSQFPTQKDAVIKLIERCGRPHFNLSIDKEHLRFGKDVPAKLRAFFAAAKATHIGVNVISVATSEYESRHRWPKRIEKLIPRDVKRRVEEHNFLGRTEPFSTGNVDSLHTALEDWKAGFSHKMYSRIATGLGISPVLGAPLSVRLSFAPDGKAYIHAGYDYLYFPQLSLGSWRRESLHDIVKTNLPFKANMLKEWFGFVKLEGRVKAGKGHFNKIAEGNPRKVEIMANHALRLFDEIKRKRSRRTK